ncbi:MAG: hypothetical protein Kow00121_36840 [Elainellaceae cyanobacterium]
MSVSSLPIATAETVEPEQCFATHVKYELQNVTPNQPCYFHRWWFSGLSGLILILASPLTSSALAANKLLLDKSTAVPPIPTAASRKFDRAAETALKPIESDRFAVSSSTQPPQSIFPVVEPEPPLRLVASPDNLDPGLELPPPEPDPYDPLESPATIVRPPGLESLEIDFRNDRDNYGQLNRIFEPTVRVRLPDGSAIRVRTGYNLFDQSHVEPITNVPLQVGWEGTIDRTTIQFGAGLDFFDRLPTAFNASASASYTIFPNVTVSGVADYGPYKFNARTLENEIRAFRFGPNLYWQITPDTSLFSLFRVGLYNDGNQEQQSFTRLEHQFGDFYVAANLFTWNYNENVENSSGYFSPPDFLVYNAEAGWNGEITDFLSCRFAVTFGRQRLQRETDSASAYRALCTTRFSSRIEADLGYTYSNVRTATGGGGYNNHSFTGQLRFSF